MLYEANGPVYHAAIDALTGNAQELVAAVAGKKIRVVGLLAAIDADGTLQLADDAGTPNKLTGAMSVKAAGPPLELPYHPSGWGDTAAGQALTVSVGAQTINGALAYQLIV